MSTNPSYKPSEGKREEFRKYLEKNGVMDALTKVLVNLYEEAEKPEDAIEYIRDKLASMAGIETQKVLQQKLDEAEERVKELEKQLESAGAATEISVGKGSEDQLDDQQPIGSAENVPSDEPAPEGIPEESPDPEQ